MDNLITVFMNYKVNRLIEYGVFLYQKDSFFIRDIFMNYFQTYIDNYYYGVFNTIDDEHYNRRNLKLELSGMMEELLYDYQDCESKVSPEEYHENQKIIRELKDISFEIIKFDTLEFPSKDAIGDVVESFLLGQSWLATNVQKREERLIRMIRETYQNEQRLLQYEIQNFSFREKHFAGREDCVWLELIPTIRVLEVYRKGLIEKVSNDERLEFDKLRCLIQKISHMLLLQFLRKETPKKIFISLPDRLVSRGRIHEEIYSLMDNPIFQKNVFLAVDYSTYLNQKAAFSEDFHFACVQDFSHINDVYMKVDNIYNEGFSHYLIVSNYKPDDKDFFVRYKNEVMSVLLFEEE